MAEKVRRDVLYGRRWKETTRQHLAENPLCVICQSRDRVTAATVVDHIEPHRLDPVIFWDPANRQSLCKSCHDKIKQQQERRGYSTEIGPDGYPLDPSHPFWQGTGGG